MLPALLAGLLVAMAAAQFALTDSIALPEVGPVGGGRPVSALAEAGAFAVSPVIAARPIFAPRGTVSAGSDSAAPASPLGGTVIAGSITGRRNYAIVQTPDGQTLRVPIGGSIAGWRLIGLSSTGARLARGGERLSVTFGAGATEKSETPEEGEGDQP